MRIRALVHIAGPGFALGPGDETDLFPDAEAARLVAKRAAALVDVAPQIERAIETPMIEKRVGRPRKAKG